MKPTRIRALALLLLTLQGVNTAAAAEYVILKLTVHRAGMVRLNGEDWIDMTGESGRAPTPWTDFSLQEVSIEPGRYRVSLRPRDLNVLPPFEEIEVSGTAGDTLYVELGRPTLLSSPPGARVLVGGSEIGVTPIHISPETLWGAEVLLDLEGYRRVNFRGDSLLASTGDPGSKRVELDPLELPLSARYDETGHSWFHRNKPLAIGGAAALMAAGIYAAVRFKDQADESYGAYLRTGNRRDQKQLFDKAVRYDRLSLVGWTVGEAAFLATFFLIIHEEPRGLIPTAGIDQEPATGEARYRLGLRHGF